MLRTSRISPISGQRKKSKRTYQLWTLPLFLLLLISFFLYHAPAARAGGGGMIIHWDTSMIFAGQNNGYPWGPVGENAIVHGANFSPSQQLNLIVVPGDSNNNATLCQQAGITIATVETDTSGTFTQNFKWPASAGQVNQEYSLCTKLASDGTSIISSQDDGPFTVLTANPPVIDISPASVQAGGTVTVTGHNWVPPQQVSINIAGCAACEPGNSEVTNASTTSHGLNDGSFSVSITIPASTKPGSYVVDALTPSGLEAFYTTGVKHLTIAGSSVTSPPTAIPSPSAQATVSATSVSTATATTSVSSTGNANTGSSDNGGNSNTFVLILLIVIALVLFAIAGIVIFKAMQRSRNQDHPVETAQYMQRMQQGASPPNFAQPQPLPPGWTPSNFNQPTQQASYTPIPQGQSYNTVGQSVACRNCGRPLPPNVIVCNTCGMQQVIVPGTNRSDWVR